MAVWGGGDKGDERIVMKSFYYSAVLQPVVVAIPLLCFNAYAWQSDFNLA